MTIQTLYIYQKWCYWLVKNNISLSYCKYILLFLQPSTNVGSLFKDKMVQFRITCTGSPEVIQQIFISGEDQVFMECPDIELMKALVDLISLYYVFHVTYPDSMIGILSFLQDIALGCTDIAYKGTKYSSFMAELRNIMC